MSDPTDTDTTEVEKVEAPEASAESPTKPEPPVYDRDAARSKIFGTKPEVYKMKLNGVPVNLVQPTMSDVLSLQASQPGEERKEMVARLMISYVQLPTGDRVFEEGDVAEILAMPWNNDIFNLQGKIMEYMGVTPAPEDKSTSEA